MRPTWLNVLFDASLVIQVVANLIVMQCLYPAYKSTKHRGFLYLFLGYLIGTFDTVCDHSISLLPMAHFQYVIYHTLRRFTYFADIVLCTAGLIWLTKSFLELMQPKPVGEAK